MSLLGYWKCNDNTSSTTVIDYSGNGNNGTFVDAGGNANTNAHHVQGFAEGGGAFLFDGVDDCVNTGVNLNTAIGDSTDWSWTAWILITTNLQQNTTFFGVSGVPRFYFEFGNDAGYDGWGYGDSFGNFWSDGGNITFKADMWVHVAVTYDAVNDLMTGYADGKQTTQITTGSDQDMPDTNLIFGGDNVTKFGACRLSHIRLYDECLSLENINRIRELEAPSILGNLR